MFPTKILVAVDGSEGASLALRTAVELAYGTNSELHLVHVVPKASEKPYPYSWANHSWAKDRSEAQLEWRRLRGLELLDRQARRVEEVFGGAVTATHYTEGRPDESIVRLCEAIDAGLIVTGGRRRPWHERIFDAGLSERLLRWAERPVMLVGDSGGRRGTSVSRNHQS